MSSQELAASARPVNSDMRHAIVESRLRVLLSGDLREGGLEGIEVNGWPILLARTDGVVRATINRCTHAAAAFLPGGRARRGVLMCPAHGARFDLADGRCLGGLYRPLRTFACREADGWIEVDVPADPPGADERPVQR